jgi:hypothetical protein
MSRTLSLAAPFSPEMVTSALTTEVVKHRSDGITHLRETCIEFTKRATGNPHRFKGKALDGIVSIDKNKLFVMYRVGIYIEHYFLEKPPQRMGFLFNAF